MSVQRTGALLLAAVLVLALGALPAAAQQNTVPQQGMQRGGAGMGPMSMVPAGEVAQTGFVRFTVPAGYMAMVMPQAVTGMEQGAGQDEGLAFIVITVPLEEGDPPLEEMKEEDFDWSALQQAPDMPEGVQVEGERLDRYGRSWYRAEVEEASGQAADHVVFWITDHRDHRVLVLFSAPRARQGEVGGLEQTLLKELELVGG